jgi:hypothetical protein
MLLLRDPEHNELALSDPFLRLCIPDRHGLSTTTSPGGKVDQEDFPPAKLRQRYRRAIRDAGQGEIRVRLAHARRVAVGVRRRGKKTKASTSQHQQAQISHSPVLLKKFVLVDLQELTYNYQLS